MTTFTLLGLFTVKEYPIWSYVARIIDYPVIFRSIFDSFWSDSTMKSKPVISTIELKTQSILLGNLNFRSAVNSNPYYFTSFNTFRSRISLRPSLNKAIIHNIRDNLVHNFIITDTDSMIGNIPLTRTIILCQPLSVRLRIFPFHSEANAIPVIRGLGI